MASFNTTTYDTSSTSFNILDPTYITGNNSIYMSGPTYYNGLFGNVMCGFAVDGVDSILGGNVIITGDISACGNVVVNKNLSVVNGNIFVGGNILTTKAYVDASINLTRGYVDTSITGAKAYTDTSITGAKAYTDASVNLVRTYVDTSITGAKLYTDASINSVKTYIDASVNSVRTYVDASINNIFSTNRTYTGKLVFNGDISLNGNCAFNNYLPTSTLTPSLSSQLTTKAYVDSQIPSLTGYATLSANNTWTGNNSFTLPVTINCGNYNQCLSSWSCFPNATTATGTNNIAIGSTILQLLTSGSNNFCIGCNNLNSIVSGNQNIVFGYNNAVSIGSSSTNNVCFGSYILNSTTATVNENTMIGLNAGTYCKGSYNTMIGSQTTQPVTDTNTYNYSTAIGYGAVNTASNQIVLGRATEYVYCPGKLGIGTNSPTELLHLNGINANIAGPHTYITTSSNSAYPIFQQLNWSNDNISLNFDMYFNGTLWKSGYSANGVGYQIYKNNGALNFNYSTYTANTGGQTLTLNTGMSMDSGGNIAMNKNLTVSGQMSTPSKLLFSQSTYAPPSVGTTGGTGDRLILWGGSSTGYPYSIGIDASTLWYGSNGSHKWYTNSTTTATLDSTGNLTVPGAVSAGSIWSKVYYNSSNTYVGINNSNPVYQLDVVGGVSIRALTTVPLSIQPGAGNDIGYVIYFTNSTGSLRGSIYGVNASSVSYNTTSDRRLKTNIQDMPSMMDKIKALKPRTYNWVIDDEDGDGFIAQEVFQVFPRLRPIYRTESNEYDLENPVKDNGEPFIYGLDYGRFTPYLTKALQETIAIVEEQNETITKLQDELTKIKQYLNLI